MKENLIVVSAYCPTESKERKLESLIDKIQTLRDRFDVLVVSHSPVGREIQSKIDHFYYDSNNEILRDFDLSYLAWFENESFFIETSLVYNMTTAVAIARQVRYSINFADFWGYEKIHYMEYDFVYPGDDFVIQNNLHLESYDTVMMDHPLNNGLFASSVYFAFTTKGLDKESRNFNRGEFLDLIRNSQNLNLEVGRDLCMTNHGRMTENLNVILFSKKERRTLYLPSLGQDQTEDSHNNSEMKWAFPVYDNTKNCLLFFVHNKKETKIKVDVKVNDHDSIRVECYPGNWMMDYLCDISEDKKIEIWVDDIFQKKVEINSSNIEKFKRNNFIHYR